MSMTTSEPTTGEIVRALRCDGDIDNIDCSGCHYDEYGCYGMKADAADRLESQEATIATMRGDNFDATSVTNVLAYLDTVMGLIHCADGIKDLIVSMQGTAAELTARVEQAEREREAAIADIRMLINKYDNIKCMDVCAGECNDCATSASGTARGFKWRGKPQEGENE